MRQRLRTPEEGADTVVWLAVAPAVPLGRFWFDRAPQATHFLPFTTERPRDRARLWRTCTRLTGLAPASADPRSPHA
jgi:hypothetical protein